MKTLSKHILKSFTPVKENQESIVENEINMQKKLLMKMNL